MFFFHIINSTRALLFLLIIVIIIFIISVTIYHLETDILHRHHVLRLLTQAQLLADAFGSFAA